MKFKNFLKSLEEETTVSDIATVDTKLDSVKRVKSEKGKKCKKHRRTNCLECEEQIEESKWN